MNEADPIYAGGAFEGEDDSEAIVGQITVSMFCVKFESEAFTLDLPTQGLDVAFDESGERVLFSHPSYPNWTVYSLEPHIIHHRAFQQQFLKQKIDALRTEHEGTPRHTIIVYSALGGIALVFFFLWAFSNLILGMIVAAMPSSWEKQIGESAFTELTEMAKPISDAAYTNRLFLVTERLKKGLPTDAPKFSFVVGDDDMVNAFALPGGHVVVMRGLIEEATPDELAGVLSHEVSHVIQKHGMRQLAQMIGPIFVFKYMFNSDSALASMIAVSAALGSLQYSRAAEAEADDKGFDILLRANIDPRSLTSFFQKIRKQEAKRDEQDVFSTHPATAARIKHLEERWRNSPKKSGFAPVFGGADPKSATTN